MQDYIIPLSEGISLKEFYDDIERSSLDDFHNDIERRAIKRADCLSIYVFSIIIVIVIIIVVGPHL